MTEANSKKKRKAAYVWLSIAIVIVLSLYRYSIHLLSVLRNGPQPHPLSPITDWLEFGLFVSLLALIWFAFRTWRDVTLRAEADRAANREDRRLLSEMREKYTQLKEIEDLRDNLTYMIVHDLKTPLTAVSGYQDILKRYSSHKLDENEQGYLDECCKQTTRLANMITSVLDVTRLESNEMTLNMEPCDLIPIAEEAIDTLASQASEMVGIDAEERPIIGFCDPDVIGRVILNLVDNAVKSTPSDGKVTVKMERKSPERICISVTDTGSGIPPEYHEKIFERFGRLRVQKYSTGLGLTFCKLAVEAHMGDIGVESELGKGSTFWFTLPTTPPV